MKVEFWGAARTVTGSMHLVEANGTRLLLDCGLYQGRRKEAFRRNRDFPFDPASIDAVLLSHAHIDHSGNLPTLVRAGFRGRVYATSATRDLCALMLQDSAKIQEADVRRANRRRRKQGKRLFEPLYTGDDAVEALQRFSTLEYEHPLEVSPGIQVRFVDAGHILGSASVVVDVDERGRRRRLLFSGDVGNSDLPILRDPTTVGDVDILIMESTYGTRAHDSADHADAVVNDVLADCCERNGKILVPAFAVGRTQSLVYRLNRMWETGELPPIRVFVDSPLGVNVTDVYRLHPECYSAEALDAVESEADHDPLGFERLTYIRRVEQSKRLNHLDKPAIIIAASGMCEGGRIVHHLAHHVGKRSTTVLFVGWQAPNTLGRKILEGQSPVRIFDDPFDVRARIVKGGAFSAHADGPGLLAWAEKVRETGRVEQVFLVHGEEASALELAGAMSQRGFRGVAVPERGAVHEV